MRVPSSMLDLVPSPWCERLRDLACLARQDLLLASPYVTSDAVDDLARSIPQERAHLLHITLLTNLAVRSVVEGSVEPEALLTIMDVLPTSRVVTVPSLHAKTYVADETAAIITSANLTGGGLYRNYEYGVLIRDPRVVRQVREDLAGYAKVGNEVSRARLEAIRGAVERVREGHLRLARSARARLRAEYEKHLARATTEVLRATAAGRTTNGIFSDTVLYLLERYGPLTTRQLHPLVQGVHPQLCDDTMDRVIEGVHFGKLWKHYVRNAQQFLKRRGLVVFDGRCWRLA